MLGSPVLGPRRGAGDVCTRPRDSAWPAARVTGHVTRRSPVTGDVGSGAGRPGIRLGAVACQCTVLLCNWWWLMFIYLFIYLTYNGIHMI